MKKLILAGLLQILLLFPLVNPEALASFSVVGAAGNGFSARDELSSFSPSSIRPTLGVEATVGVLRLLEMGIFYDHTFLSGGSLSNFGFVGRVGIGSLSGFFVDAKGGLAFANAQGLPSAGIGAGLGLGYHLNEIFSPRMSFRVVTGADIIQTIADVGLMITL